MMRIVRTVDRIMSDMPFEVLFTVLLILSGLPMAFGALPSPNSVIRVLPEILVRMWGVLLSVGGLITLTGLAMSHADQRRRFIEGLLVESGGLLIIGSGAAVFALCILVASGWAAAFSVAIYFVLTASCLFRFRTLRRTVAKMREAVELERKLQGGE